MATIFKCSGTTSWGDKWFMKYDDGIQFMTPDNEPYLLITGWDGNLIEKEIGNKHHIRPMQHAELIATASKAYIRCYKALNGIKPIVKDMAKKNLAPIMPDVTNFYQFLDSSRYKNMVRAMVEVIRLLLELPCKSEDWLFEEAKEDDEYDEGGPIYKAVNEEMIDVASDMTPEGSDYGWLVNPETFEWNPNPQINPITGKRYNGEHDI